MNTTPSNQASGDGATHEPNTLLNEFLNFAARAGNLSIQNIRHTVRQPETEAFSRKVVATFHEIAPEAKVSVLVTTIPAAPGAAALNSASSDAAAQELSRHLPSPDAQTAQYFLDNFSLFHAAARVDLINRSSNTPAFGHNPVTVAASTYGLQGDETILMAADSVYTQSFADVQALSVIAARGGINIALQVLDMVEARRAAGGDFGTFSKAPLSHDSSYALQLFRAQLRMGHDLRSLGAAAIVERSALLARQGLGVWLGQHGMEPKEVAKLIDSLGIIDKTLFAPAVKPAPAPRPAMRTT